MTLRFQLLLRDTVASVTSMRVIVCLAVLFGACSFDPGIPVDDRLPKVRWQDKSMLLYESAVELAYGVELGHEWERANVHWSTEDGCPWYEGTQINVEPHGCVWGVTYGCDQIYVAIDWDGVSDVRDLKPSGTALLHEFGHCLREKVLGDPDGDHSDDDWWSLVADVRAETAVRGW